MADIRGHDAAKYAQTVAAPADDEEFSVGVATDRLPMVPRGRKAFSSLANGDTIAYKAVSKDDPSKWEVGVGTYDSTNKTIDRTDAGVLASSNSDNRVDFKGSDDRGAAVWLEGIPFLTDEAALTDNSGGTASDTIAAISATPTQAEVQNAIASLAAKINAILAAAK